MTAAASPLTLCLALLAALAAAPLAAGELLGRWSIAVIALYGGLAFAIYPMAVAHLVDHLNNEDIVAGSTVLLLLHGVGAAIGPVLAGGMMNIFGPAALAAHFAVAQLLLAIAAYASVRRHSEEITDPAHFMPMVRTTPTVLEIMPTPETADGAEAADTAAPGPAPQQNE